MKIAITADLHLRTKKDYPERFKALDNILSQCIKLKIKILIIAGDLFDQNQASFTDFENICKKQKYKNLRIIAIRGNHDSDLSNKKISASNVEIIENPKIIDIDN